DGICLVWQRANDFLGEVNRSLVSAQIARQRLTLGQNFFERGLYPFGDPAFAQVLQHQHRTLEQCSRICDSASGDAGSSPVNRFEDGDLFANVCAGRNAQPAHESSSKIRDDVSVKVLQQQNIKLVGVDHELHAGVVYDQIVCFDIRIVFGNFPETVQEQA